MKRSHAPPTRAQGSIRDAEFRQGCVVIARTRVNASIDSMVAQHVRKREDHLLVSIWRHG
eukprot:COSAG02_NODE_588_length_19902_cov_115.928900_16_plen_60_part_00